MQTAPNYEYIRFCSEKHLCNFVYIFNTVECKLIPLLFLLSLKLVRVFSHADEQSLHL